MYWPRTVLDLGLSSFSMAAMQKILQKKRCTIVIKRIKGKKKYIKDARSEHQAKIGATIKQVINGRKKSYANLSNRVSKYRVSYIKGVANSQEVNFWKKRENL